MELTKQLIATLVVALRNYQTMQVLNLLPPFIEDMAHDLGLSDETHQRIEVLIDGLNGALSGLPGAEKAVRVDNIGVLLIAGSLIHLHYSLVSNHDLNHIFDVCNELGIAQLKRKRVADIFQRVCRGLRMSEFDRHLLQETFARNRSLQLEELLLPKMMPSEQIFFRYA